MATANFIAENSRYFENFLEHRFIHDLARWLITQDPPRMLNVLKAEVDQFGFDLVLSVGGTTRHVQMKTRSGRPPSRGYHIADNLWAQRGGCVVWIQYESGTLEPTGYFLLGPTLPSIDQFEMSDRDGYRLIKMQRANHQNLSIAQLGGTLFGSSNEKRAAFFFGSGISYESKAAGVDEITREALTGQWSWHTSGRFIRAVVSDDRVFRLQRFLHLVKVHIETRLGDRPPEKCNYEDVYAALVEIREHFTLELPNPLVADVTAELAAEAERLACHCPKGGGNQSPFSALCSEAIDLIQQVAYSLLSDIPSVNKLEMISSVATVVKELDIFTLNHDLLVERQLKSNGIIPADGFGKQDGQVREFNGNWVPEGQLVRILKLHGSINWFLAPRKGGYRQYVATESDPEHLKDSDGNWINLFESAKPRFLSGTRVKSRAYSRDVIGEIFAKFREFTSNHRTIIFCGYGFGDHEINQRILQWLFDQRDNKIIILHHYGEAAILKMPFWENRYAAFGPKKVQVIAKWLYECSLAELDPYFDVISV